MVNAQTSSTSSKKSTPPSMIGKSFHLVFNLLFTALFSWMLLLLFAAFAVFHWGWQNVWAIFQEAILGMTSHLWISHLGLDGVIHKADTMTQLSPWLALAFPVDAVPVEKLIHGGTNAWVTFLLVTQFTVERLQVFLFGLFVITTFSLLGFIDGLVQRDLRKFNNARESTLFFHRSKTFLSTIFFTGYFLFMTLPFNMPLTLFLMLMALGISILIQLATKQFKKHL